MTQSEDAAAVGLLDELVIDSADGTTSVRIEADIREVAPDNGQEFFPGFRLPLVTPESGKQNG